MIITVGTHPIVIDCSDENIDPAITLDIVDCNHAANVASVTSAPANPMRDKSGSTRAYEAGPPATEPAVTRTTAHSGETSTPSSSLLFPTLAKATWSVLLNKIKETSFWTNHGFSFSEIRVSAYPLSVINTLVANSTVYPSLDGNVYSILY